MFACGFSVAKLLRQIEADRKWMREKDKAEREAQRAANEGSAPGRDGATEGKEEAVDGEGESEEEKEEAAVKPPLKTVASDKGLSDLSHRAIGPFPIAKEQGEWQVARGGGASGKR